MEHLNKVLLRGVVGSVRTQQVGDSRVCNFSLCTDRCYNNKNGEQVIETTWHSCSAWEKNDGPSIDIIQRGAKIELEGRFRNRKYTTSDGEERSYSDIFVYKFSAVE